MAEPEEVPAERPVPIQRPNIRFVGAGPMTAVITILALLCLAWGFFNYKV